MDLQLTTSSQLIAMPGPSHNPATLITSLQLITNFTGLPNPAARGAGGANYLETQRLISAPNHDDHACTSQLLAAQS